MARIRSVHPGLYTDDAFMALSMGARMLLIGLWSHADDGGGFEWKPVVLKARIFPADNLDIAPILEELVGNDVIQKYDVEGKSYGAVRNFGKWQRAKKPTRFVPMPEPVRKYCQSETICSDTETGISSEPVPNQFGNSSAEGRKVGRYESRKGSLTPIPPAGGFADDPTTIDVVPEPEPDARPMLTTPAEVEKAREFAEFWVAYPRKDGKRQAEKAWRTAKKRGTVAEIMTGLSRFTAVWPTHHSEPRFQFIPHPATWLNNDGWNGDPMHSAAAQKGGNQPKSSENMDWMVAEMMGARR